jgi:hypothetical protein
LNDLCRPIRYERFTIRGEAEIALLRSRFQLHLNRNKETILARNNYGFQKRSRELAKKKKKEEKRLRKQAKAEPEVVENAETTEEQADVAETPSEAEEGAVETDR